MLSSIVDSFEKLTSVQSYSFRELPDDVSAIKLQFGTFTCVFKVVEDTDEVEILNDVDLSEFVINKDENVFSRCLGLKLCWAWEMRNNQGYFDSVRLEFENEQIVEIVVTASSFRQYLVNEL